MVIADAWEWVMLWLDIIPPVSMVKILTENFFPKWMRTLSTWLSSNPNFDEVTRWYLEWKARFPEQLLSDVSIKSLFIYFQTSVLLLNLVILTFDFIIAMHLLSIAI